MSIPTLTLGLIISFRDERPSQFKSTVQLRLRLIFVSIVAYTDYHIFAGIRMYPPTMNTSLYLVTFPQMLSTV